MLMRQTLLYMPAQLVGPLAQLVGVFGWTHWMAPDQYGTLIYLIAVQELCFMPTLAWFAAYAVRYLSAMEAEGSLGRFADAECAVLVVGSIAQAGVLVALFPLLGLPLTAATVTTGAAFAVTRSLLQYASERARGDMRIDAYSVAQIVGPTLGLTAGFALIWTVSASPAAVLGGFAIGQAVALAAATRVLRMRLRLRLPDRELLAAALRYGVPLSVGGLVGWASQNGIRVVVEATGGLAAVGLLSVGWALGQRFSSVAAMLVTAAAFPIAVRRLATGDRSGAIRQVAANGAAILALLAPVVAGVWAVTVPVTQLLVAPEFRATTVAILPLAVLTGALRNLRIHGTDQILLLFERSTLIMALFTAEAAVTGAFCILGVLNYGIVGAVVGCLAAAALSLLASLAVGAFAFGLRPPVGDAVRTVAASGLMALALRAVAWPATVGGLAAEIVAGACVYAGALAFLYPHIAARTLGGLRRQARTSLSRA